jgi:MFS family permease
MGAADRDSFSSPHRWRVWFGLNPSTLALLGTILLVTSATELWSPLVPQYLKALRARATAGDMLTLLLIGLYGFYRDFLEAINYFLGGAIAGTLNTRRSLLLFNFVPLIGLGVLLIWPSWIGVFVAIPFIFVWDSIAGPATITVVGDSVTAARRTMAFSLQAIFRRLSRILAYCISAPLILYLGEVDGVRADVAIAIVLLLAAVGIQHRFMQTASRDTGIALGRPRELFVRFQPELRRLLWADVCARWAEGLAGPFIILYCVPILDADSAKGTALYQSVLLSIQAVTNVALYLLIGPLASREGFGKKPYIALTFLFFALFPVSLTVLGGPLGFLGLTVAFVIGGLREIGEPARKAMIADLVPPDVKTQAIGLYWSVRSVAVMWASPVGAVLWILGNRLAPETGPHWTFGAAGAIGLIGAGIFYLKFGHHGDVPRPLDSPEPHVAKNSADR